MSGEYEITQRNVDPEKVDLTRELAAAFRRAFDRRIARGEPALPTWRSVRLGQAERRARAPR